MEKRAFGIADDIWSSFSIYSFHSILRSWSHGQSFIAITGVVNLRAGHSCVELLPEASGEYIPTRCPSYERVSPDLYGDNNTRLFTYWTSDAYQATGCYNLLCSGFIQVNSGIAMGASISPVSAFRNSQYDIGILVWKGLPFLFYYTIAKSYISMEEVKSGLLSQISHFHFGQPSLAPRSFFGVEDFLDDDNSRPYTYQKEKKSKTPNKHVSFKHRSIAYMEPFTLDVFISKTFRLCFDHPQSDV